MKDLISTKFPVSSSNTVRFYDSILKFFRENFILMDIYLPFKLTIN